MSHSKGLPIAAVTNKAPVALALNRIGPTLQPPNHDKKQSYTSMLSDSLCVVSEETGLRSVPQMEGKYMFGV